MDGLNGNKDSTYVGGGRFARRSCGSLVGGVEASKMMEYQERVVAERKELNERLIKLREFNAGRVFKQLPEAERNRLTRQCMIMTSYLDILNQRISAFGN